MTNRADRRLDLVVFGATSFVGQILCRHLVARHGTDGDLRWAIAGRDAAKLDRVAASTGADVERIVADATDSAALRRLTASTRWSCRPSGRTRCTARRWSRRSRRGHRLLRPHR
jgi:short subunit dehydrogenase-like uncharacterized protein